jgi:hypothetical protein
MENVESDVDVFIIGNINLKELDNVIPAIENTTGRTINSTVYTLNEFNIKKKQNNQFIMNVIRRKKIMLMGNEYEL